MYEILNCPLSYTIATSLEESLPSFEITSLSEYPLHGVLLVLQEESMLVSWLNPSPVRISSTVGVAVAVGVNVGVGVNVSVGVNVGVGVSVGVGVNVGVGVWVAQMFVTELISQAIETIATTNTSTDSTEIILFFITFLQFLFLIKRMPTCSTCFFLKRHFPR